MVMIIEFRGNTARGEVRAEEGKAQGQIIIFPGVRRERHAEGESEGSADCTEPEALEKPRRRSKPKRDRIELPE